MSDQKNNGSEDQNDNQSRQDRPQDNPTHSAGSSITKLLTVLLSLPGAPQFFEWVTKHFLLIGISSLVGIGIGIGATGRFFQPAWGSGQQKSKPRPPSDLLPIDLNEVCKHPKYYDLKKGTNYQNITPGSPTQLSDDKEKTLPVYRWRCQYLESGDHNTKLAGLNLNLFCQNYYNKKFYSFYLHYDDPESWYCVKPKQFQAN